MTRSERNNALPQRAKEFVAYLPAMKGLSLNTVESYSNDLILLLRFLKQEKGLVPEGTVFEEIDITDIGDAFLREITENDLILFVHWSKIDRGNAERTRARKIASLRAFFRYLHKRARVIDEDPAADLESPKVGKRKPVYLSYDESLALLRSVVGNGRNEKRDFCILTLFLNSGMRLSELCAVDLASIRGDSLLLLGKGNKERRVPLNASCLRAIDAYLPERQALVKGNESTMTADTKRALFLSERRKRISRRTVQDLVDKYLVAAGLSGRKYTTHKLRHTAASLMYQNGADIVSLQQLLGHDNISTTQIYVHIEDDQIRRAVNLNPLDEELDDIVDPPEYHDE